MHEHFPLATIYRQSGKLLIKCIKRAADMPMGFIRFQDIRVSLPNLDSKLSEKESNLVLNFCAFHLIKQIRRVLTQYVYELCTVVAKVKAIR